MQATNSPPSLLPDANERTIWNEEKCSIWLEYFVKSHFTWVDELFSRIFCFKFLQHTVWRNQKFTFNRKIFRQIIYLGEFFGKTSISRNFCQKCVRVNFHAQQKAGIGNENFVKSMISQKWCHNLIWRKKSNFYTVSAHTALFFFFP